MKLIRVPNSNRLRGSGLVMAMAAVVLSACGQGDRQAPTGELPLAKVGQTTVRLQDLKRYEANLPEMYRAQGSALQVVREHLQALVDRELMVLEARERQIDRRPAVVSLADSLAHHRMAEALIELHVSSKVAVTEEELREAYEFHELGWQVWPAHLLSASEEEAWEAHRLLVEGADFGNLARQRSRADDAERGGEIRQFFSAGDAVPELWQGTAKLEIGEFSEPIRTLDGWEIVQVLDRQRLRFEQMRGNIEPEARRRKWAGLRLEYLNGLREHFGVRLHEGRAQRVLDLIGPAGSAAVADDDEPLISWKGGHLSVATAAQRLLRATHGGRPGDDQEVFEFLELWVLPDTLLVLAAREAGMDREPALVAWRQAQLDRLSVQALRHDLLAGQVSVTEEELRRFYRDNTERYSLPGRIFLTEVLVDSKDEAQNVLELVRDGASLEQLARERSVRPPAEGDDRHMHIDENGRMVIEPLRSSPYHTVFPDVGDDRVGELFGPIEMEGRFAVVRLDRPIEPFYVPYEKVRRQVLFQVKKQKADAAFEAVIADIRSRHADQVTWYEENLAAAASRTGTP